MTGMSLVENEDIYGVYEEMVQTYSERITKTSGANRDAL